MSISTAVTHQSPVSLYADLSFSFSFPFSFFFFSLLRICGFLIAFLVVYGGLRWFMVGLQWVSVAGWQWGSFLVDSGGLWCGYFLLICFTLLQTHNVKYFLEHFPKVQTNIGKTYVFL
jgi:hypothetical protein